MLTPTPGTSLSSSGRPLIRRRFRSLPELRKLVPAYILVPTPKNQIECETSHKRWVLAPKSIGNSCKKLHNDQVPVPPLKSVDPNESANRALVHKMVDFMGFLSYEVVDLAKETYLDVSVPDASVFSWISGQSISAHRKAQSLDESADSR